MKIRLTTLLLSAALLVYTSTAEATQVTNVTSNVVGFNNVNKQKKVKVTRSQKTTAVVETTHCSMFSKNEGQKCKTVVNVIIEAASFNYSYSAKNLAVADDWIGVTETQGREELKSFMGIDPRKTAWCVGFINAVLKRAGKQPLDTLTARGYLNYGVRTKNPSPGDIVVLRNSRGNHAGFYVATVVKDGRKYVKVLGGNQGNAVKVALYPASSVIQYRTSASRVASN